MLEIIKGPYLQSPKIDGMTIMWETSMPASSCVEVLLAERIHSGHQGNYRKPDQVLFTIQHEDLTTIHRLTVEGLAPEQLYFYRISSRDTDSEVISDTYPLKTAVPPGGAFSFAVTSETGGYSGFDTTGGSINRRIFQQMQRYRSDLALFIGDIVNDGREYEDWETYFFGPGRDFLTNTPFYSCLGNHECNGEWYYKYFDFPSQEIIIPLTTAMFILHVWTAPTLFPMIPIRTKMEALHRATHSLIFLYKIWLLRWPSGRLSSFTIHRMSLAVIKSRICGS